MSQSRLVKPKIPYNVEPAILNSVAPYIDSQKYYEVLPDSNTSYNNLTNNKISFRISSTTQFLDLANSYFRMKLTTDLNFNGSSDPFRTLNEGGVHAIFGKIVVRTQGGKVLYECDRYNYLQAMISNAIESRPHIDTHKALCGDSVDPFYTNQITGDKVVISDSASSYNWTDATKTLTDVTRGLLARPGDRLCFSSAAGTDFWGTVKTVTPTGSAADSLQATIVLASVSTAPGGNLTDIANIVILRSNAGTVKSTRWDVATTDSVDVTFQPLLPFFQSTQWMYLPHVPGGLIVDLYMDNVTSHILRSGRNWAYQSTGFADGSVTIEQPRYFVRLITPNDELKDTYTRMFASENGYYYSFTGFSLQTISNSTASTFNMQFNSNKRSVKFALIAIKDDRHINTFTTDKRVSSYGIDSLADSRTYGLSKYYMSAHSLRYPLDSYIEINDKFMLEPLTHLQLTMGNYGVLTGNHRFIPQDWYKQNYDDVSYSSETADSKRFLIAIHLGSDFSNLAGLDLGNVPWSAYMEFGLYNFPSESLTSRYFMVFLAHDSVVWMQRQDLVTVYN